MAYSRKLGVFVRSPRPGEVKSRLVPPLSAEEACELYVAFLRDLFAGLQSLKKLEGTVFFSGGDPEPVREIAPKRFRLVDQAGAELGERLRNAFEALLADGRSAAVIIGSDSPDLPARYVKRAFDKLKHHDVVLGPAFDGGYYLIGLRRVVPALFEGVSWGGPSVFADTLERIRDADLACSILPLWYDVDDFASLALLEALVCGRRIEGGRRLVHTEAVLERVRSAVRPRGPSR